MGPNGQGKSNFLEAIHYLAVFRSYRGTRHSDTIAFGADHFRVEGRVAYSDGRSRSVAVAADRSQRRIMLDEQAVAQPIDAVGTLLTVMLAPDDLVLIGGSPSDRRRYLDTVLGLTSVLYRKEMHEFERALRQRNELLRERASPSLIEAWDEAMIAAGTGVIMARAGLVERIGGKFSGVGAQLAGPGESVDFGVHYRPSVPVAIESHPDEDAVATAWREELRHSFDKDRIRGWTTIGPHRDELLISLGERPIARFGSQGEKRSAAIALRLVEADILEDDTEHEPILLLDDVFSELDHERAGRLLEWLGERHQRFITSPRPLPGLSTGLENWEIEEGVIEQTAVAV